MRIPDPLTPIAITAGIITNMTYDILKHRAQDFEGTLVGQMLKWAGLIEPNFEDRLQNTLSKALRLYFKEHPKYALSGIEAFFRDPVVARQIGNYILDRQPLDQNQIQQAFDQHLGDHALARVLIQQRGLAPESIIPDFLECYHRVLSEQLSVPQMSILLEVLTQTKTLVDQIRTSEERLKDYIHGLLESKLSPQTLQAIYRSGQQELARNLTEAMDTVGLVKPDQATQIIQKRFQSIPTLFANGLCKGRFLRISTDQYFVSHGFDTNTLADWRQTLTETLAHASSSEQQLKPHFSGDTLLGGFRLCGICEKLYATRFSVFLLPPSQDRNVYLELGIAIGLGAPFFLIQHYKASIPPILEGLSRYTKGGLFRTMRRELAGQIEEYDFGVVYFTKNFPAPGSQPKYLIAAGELPEDEDFDGSVKEGIGSSYSYLEAISLSERLGSTHGSSWMLEHLFEAIQTSRFAIFRVDETCSPITFLALGISIGINRPFLMVHEAGRAIPLDLQGIGMYKFLNFGTLQQEIVSKHRSFFEEYT